MKGPAPHFLLMSEAMRAVDGEEHRTVPTGWRFVLKSVDGRKQLEAEDREPGAGGERLELLAVVRGLEALDQPSHVTLITGSRYVSRGLTEGLENWRENDWQWERFGEWVPVRDCDLWQRVDRALRYHRVECRRWRFDRAHGRAAAGPAAAPSGSSRTAVAAGVECRTAQGGPRPVRPALARDARRPGDAQRRALRQGRPVRRRPVREGRPQGAVAAIRETYRRVRRHGVLGIFAGLAG